jgi:hypothetical protein
MEEAAAPLGVELKAFQLVEVTLLPGNHPELKLVPEEVGELDLNTLTPCEQRIHGFKFHRAIVGDRLDVARQGGHL